MSILTADEPPTPIEALQAQVSGLQTALSLILSTMRAHDPDLAKKLSAIGYKASTQQERHPSPAVQKQLDRVFVDAMHALLG